MFFLVLNYKNADIINEKYIVKHCVLEKMIKNTIFFQKYLVMSKKSSTFAPAFEKEVCGM